MVKDPLSSGRMPSDKRRMRRRSDVGRDVAKPGHSDLYVPLNDGSTATISDVARAEMANRKILALSAREGIGSIFTSLDTASRPVPLQVFFDLAYRLDAGGPACDWLLATFPDAGSTGNINFTHDNADRIREGLDSLLTRIEYDETCDLARLSRLERQIRKARLGRARREAPALSDALLNANEIAAATAIPTAIASSYYKEDILQEVFTTSLEVVGGAFILTLTKWCIQTLFAEGRRSDRAADSDSFTKSDYAEAVREARRRRLERELALDSAQLVRMDGDVHLPGTQAVLGGGGRGMALDERSEQFDLIETGQESLHDKQEMLYRDLPDYRDKYQER